MESMKLTINNKTEQLEQVRSFLEQAAARWSLKTDLVFELNLILEEYITNLVNYGYHDENNHEIIIEIIKEETKIMVRITDDAGPFNIIETPENEDIDKPVEERRIGGLGIHFIKNLADLLEYESREGKNKLTILKHVL